MKNTLVFILICGFLIGLTACGPGQNAPSSVALSAETVPEDPPVVPTGGSAKPASFRYYVGGFFPAPGRPNWSDDITISLKTNGTASIDAKQTDALCFRRGTLTKAEVTQILGLYESLDLRPAPGPIRADGGIALLTVTFDDNSKKEIYLDDAEAPRDKVYAVNGDLVRTAIKSLDARLATACQ